MLFFALNNALAIEYIYILGLIFLKQYKVIKYTSNDLIKNC